MQVLVPSFMRHPTGNPGRHAAAVLPRAVEAELPEWTDAEAPSAVRWEAASKAEIRIHWTGRRADLDGHPGKRSRGGAGVELGTRWASGGHWYPCLERLPYASGLQAVCAERAEEYLNGPGSAFIDVTAHLEECGEASDPALGFGDVSHSAGGVLNALDPAGWDVAIAQGRKRRPAFDPEPGCLRAASYFALIEGRLWVRGPEPTCLLQATGAGRRPEPPQVSVRPVAGGRAGESISRALNSFPVTGADGSWRTSGRPEVLLPWSMDLTWLDLVGIGAACEIASTVCRHRTSFPADFVERSAAVRVAALRDRGEDCAAYVVEALPEVAFLNLDRTIAVGFDRVVRAFVEMASDRPIPLPPR